MNQKSKQEGLQPQTNELINLLEHSLSPEMVDIDERGSHGSLEELAHPWIRSDDHWSPKRGLSIAAWRCPVLKKIRASAESVHNHNILVGLRGYPTKCNIYMSYNIIITCIHRTYTISFITYEQRTISQSQDIQICQVISPITEPIPKLLVYRYVVLVPS